MGTYFDISKTSCQTDEHGFLIEVPGQKEYVFFSRQPFDESKVEGIENWRSKAAKGVWASELTRDKEYPSAWAALSDDEYNGFSIQDRGVFADFATIFTVSDDAKVLYIGSYEDYEKVAERYGRTDEHGFSKYGPPFLDYEKIAEDYDGIHVNCYTNDHGPLACFDIESIQMFRASAMDIQYTGSNPFDIRLEKISEDGKEKVVEHYNDKGTLMGTETFEKTDNEWRRTDFDTIGSVRNNLDIDSNGTDNVVVTSYEDSKTIENKETGEVKTEFYDKDGKLESVRTYTPEDDVHITRYDENGKATSIETIDYNYEHADDDGRISKVEYLDENGEVVSIETYEYREDGSLESITTEDAETHDVFVERYDENGNPLQETDANEVLSSVTEILSEGIDFDTDHDTSYEDKIADILESLGTTIIESFIAGCADGIEKDDRQPCDITVASDDIDTSEDAFDKESVFYTSFLEESSSAEM